MYSVLPVLNFYYFNTTIDILVFVYIYIYIQIDSRSYYMLCRYIYVCMYVYIYIYIVVSFLGIWYTYIERHTYLLYTDIQPSI